MADGKNSRYIITGCKEWPRVESQQDKQTLRDILEKTVKLQYGPVDR